jgi:hypothetical protein
MPLFTSRKQEKKVKVTFGNGLLFVEKPDGKQLAFPLEWFPKKFDNLKIIKKSLNFNLENIFKFSNHQIFKLLP